VKIRVAAGALLVMLMAPVVASSDEPSLPLLLQPQPIIFVNKPLLRAASPAAASPAAASPAAASERNAVGSREAATPAEPVVVSIDCDGGGCAVSSGLQVQVIAASRPR
jgi:hypothetical protein